MTEKLADEVFGITQASLIDRAEKLAQQVATLEKRITELDDVLQAGLVSLQTDQYGSMVRIEFSSREDAEKCIDLLIGT